MSDKELIDFIIRFTQQMNELEVKYDSLLQENSNDTPAVLEDFKAEAEKIYQKYLTPKERTYYTGICSPPKFSAVNRITLSTVERTKNRATVTFYTKIGLVDFRFILLCKNNQWLINSFQQRCHSDDRESTYKWSYGNF